MPRVAILPLSEATKSIQGLIKHFRPEMERRITEKRGGGLSLMMEAAK